MVPDPDEEWDNKGRPALLSMPDIKLLAQNLNQNLGRTAGGNDIVHAIEEKLKKRAFQQGLVPITRKGVSPSRRTISNYKAVLASDPDTSVIRKAVPKTQTRYTAENSWMSSVCFMVPQPAIIPVPNSSLPFDRLTLDIMNDCCLPLLQSFMRVRECKNMDNHASFQKIRATPNKQKKKKMSVYLEWHIKCATSRSF